MDAKLIIWVIIGIIYLISRARKKNAPPPAESRPEPETFDKPLTFDELLKEIQAAKQPKPVQKPVSTYIDYEEDTEEEERSLEKTKPDTYYKDQDQIYETYEKAKREAFYRPTMEETLKLENTVVRFGQFKNYTQDDRPSLAAEYAQDLKDQNNFKKAFILSEILNRRF